MTSGQPEGRPRGDKTQINPRSSPEVQRKLTRENDSAEILARIGYDVEQNPPPLPNGKKPDYKIEGNIFDHIAPSSSNPDQIRKGISRKVKEGQADRIILNLDDSDVTLEAFRDNLARKPIDNLQEIIVVKNGEVIPFFP